MTNYQALANQEDVVYDVDMVTIINLVYQSQND